MRNHLNAAGPTLALRDIACSIAPVSQRRKLIDAIRSNPHGVRFDDACKVAGWLGFDHTGGKGAHKTYARSGEPVGLNFQNRDGLIKPYQAKQLIDMIDKYEDEL